MKKKVINLAYPEKGDVSFKVNNFPDGDIRVDFEDLDRKSEYHILCRISSFYDFAVLAHTMDVLNRNEVIYSTYISYLLGGRMDRVIDINKSFSLKVYLNVFNAINNHSGAVYVLDPHSEVTDRLFGIANFTGESYFTSKVLDSDYDLIIFPDEGAYNRYTKFGSFMGVSTVVAKKLRSIEDGSIVSYKIDTPDFIENAKNICVIDDLCDGGRTFLLLADYINSVNPDAVKDLYITHSVNDAGLERVANVYDTVFTTNSYKDRISTENVVVCDVFDGYDEW